MEENWSESSVNALKTFDDARLSVVRTVMLGNAGGTIACLSFIGTSIARSSDGTFARGAFFVLCCFLFGLGAGVGARIVVMVSKFIAVKILLGNHSTELENARLRRIGFLDKATSISIPIAGVALVSGIMSGIIYLFLLST